MFLTNALLKPKSKNILVAVQSVITGHTRVHVRERLGDKLEFIAFDPHIRCNALYKERKKIRSLK
ncbi:PREDICTED: 39S ribosomal protein L33, mitochondrial [Dinoponera quadriceps]|uniref:39S ribosomal protein L33, mitochondrial n=1 Tax=Dinoponera quadriceps TaxID=609295 RepID=A0A6P3X1F4_DINQU|nr:PREDICTED: 39S ribosomal protein L33, mitochondrial [Dinoponera quadriceps]